MSGTEVTPATSSDLEVLDGLDTGLEDFEASDMTMPRLSIDHPNAEFVDQLTGERFQRRKVVLLGLIKQRILWAEEVKDGDRPLCKSFDFKEGHPNLPTFPFDAAGFPATDEEGTTLPCNSCALKEWDSHPKNSTPWCSEQHTFPLLMEGEEGSGQFTAPAILTVQRSAIKPSKAYLTGFARSKTPLYTVVTEIGLNPQKRGSVNYAVPSFARVQGTENTEWPEYATHYRTIREYITTPPPDIDGDTDAAPAAAAAPAASSETASAAPSDDDLPF